MTETFKRNSVHRTWLMLMLATAGTFALSTDQISGVAAGVMTLVITYIKGRLVILDFMELRNAPLVWRLAVEGWLLIVSTLLLNFYVLGKST